MTEEKLLEAFTKIIEESISNEAIKNKITRNIKGHLEVRGRFPAKGILAEINKHRDLEVSEESGRLIKEIFYYYG